MTIKTKSAKTATRTAKVDKPKEVTKEVTVDVIDDEIVDPEFKPAIELDEKETAEYETKFHEKQIAKLPWIMERVSNFHLGDAISPEDLNQYMKNGSKLEMFQFFSGKHVSKCRRITVNFTAVFATENPNVFLIYYTFDSITDTYDETKKKPFMHKINRMGVGSDRLINNITLRSYFTVLEDTNE